ncbi:chitobiosyldiphosphodolichol beta-mannosyltransferase-like [Octopus sinensis]|uniref:Beta-1,4-mannosyltransferase n=1 Tax=Octopus sinensis TaxID=2607531 RepID=A0A6P7TXB2_9MOLL|nr:chitobiosyldiphosphodolichol beta-mannosyltransferase-like [Octopus sinensis]
MSAIRLYMNILRYLLRCGKGTPVAAVVVVGDIGRSPRMQNHSVSLSENGYKTLIFGFHESTPIDNVIKNEKIKIINISRINNIFSKNSILNYFIKSVWLHLSLFFSMLLHIRHHIILVQFIHEEPHFVYEEIASSSLLRNIQCFITGKGPLKEQYLESISQRGYKHVTITTLWLEAEDYPLMLRAADVGVSLHTSSSGLDLPMKVVDMMAAGLVVLAYHYPWFLLF